MKYYLIENNIVTSVAVFNEEPTNTSNITYISTDSANLQIGGKYDVDTSTVIETLNYPTFIIESQGYSNAESKSLGGEIQGLYTTGSEGEVTDATTSSLEFVFNKNINPLSKEAFSITNATIEDFSSTDNGCIFKIKSFEIGESNIELSIPKSNIKSVDGEYLPEPHTTNFLFSYEGILSGSIGT